MAPEFFACAKFPKAILAVPVIEVPYIRGLLCTKPDGMRIQLWQWNLPRLPELPEAS